ncbi:50S ribosomal protein L24 [Methanohalobium sp.]|uniref:50S ribosomal protein L24 n=1 Tax=Methanohalobium sp. TaxID=2837493 RepID=UPI0025D0614C|nr:50S ribosomal protein L24 [Methanohalobium sp.]
MSSKQPRKQIKSRYNAPLHKKQNFMAAPLSKELREKYGTRSVSVIVGDTVKVLRGDHATTTGKVENVSLKDGVIYIEGVTVPKADGTEMARPLDPSNVMITSLNMEDENRKTVISKRR